MNHSEISAAAKRRKVGIMGGTFDPIHIGHLILGENAYQQFHLDKVLFMPSGNPPHKKIRDGASNWQRVEMVRKAIVSNPHFALSLEEMHEEGYIYTRETLKRLHSQNPGTEYYFIMGADSLLSFDTWNGPQEICDQCILVAAVRDSLDPITFDRKIHELEERYHARIYKLDSPNIDISSSSIRAWCRDGKSIRYYVPALVRDYIIDEGLYGQI